ncbi:MAG: 4'-phosphopantetheinyl transferase family protein [Solirubrobacteraceae bacterium]
MSALAVNTDAEGAPQVILLDARANGLDQADLRACARTQGPPSASHVARSYRHPFGLVAWHSEPVGVDIERIERFNAAFAESICTPSERVALGRPAAPDAHIASLWSSKEALAKALGDALRYDPRRLESPMRWPGGAAGPWRAARLPVPAGHTAWVCWRSTRRQGES